jgi:pimeloyl-ACP methyl ester carboxylesterase
MEQTTQHLIKRTDGSTLSVWTIGPDDGRPLVLCHPAPGSGLFDPDPAVSAEAGIRIIAPNRQGYGASTLAAPPATIGQAGRDVLAALDHLGVPEAAAAGWSAGGRIAMWLAAHHPDRIRSLAVVATPTPHDAVPWIPPEYMAAIATMRVDPVAAIDQLVPMFEAALADGSASSMLAPGPANQRAMVADPGLNARLERMLDDAVGQGPLGMAADIVSYTMVDWGFEPGEIVVPTLVCSGSEDVTVPPAHGSWYAERIRSARHTVEPGAGHLVVVPVWREIVERLDGEQPVGMG